MQAEIAGQSHFETHFIQIQVCVRCTDLPIFEEPIRRSSKSSFQMCY